MTNGYIKETDTASIRYFVNNMDSAIEFYTEVLGFQVVLHPNSYFAWLSQGPLRLLLRRR